MPFVTGVIPSLFHGVSQQPSSVRAAGQLEEQINCLSSVALGGVAKRPGTVHIDALPDLDADVDYKFHPINRSVTEQYLLAVGDEGLFLYDAINGEDIPITHGDTSRWYVAKRAPTDATGIIEHTDAGNVAVASDYGIFLGLIRRQAGGEDAGTITTGLTSLSSTYMGDSQTVFGRATQVTTGQTVGWTGFADVSGRQTMLGCLIPSNGSLAHDDGSAASSATGTIDVSHDFGGSDNLCLVLVAIEDEASNNVTSVTIDPAGTPVALARLSSLESNNSGGNNNRMELWGVYGYTSPNATVTVRVILGGTSEATARVLTVNGAASLPTNFIRRRKTGGSSFTETLDISSSGMAIYLKPHADETTVSWTWRNTGGTTHRFKVEGSADNITWADLITGQGGTTTGTFSTTIGATGAGDHNFIRVNITTLGAGETLSLHCALKSVAYLNGSRDDFACLSVADYTFILNRRYVTMLNPVNTTATVDDVVYTAPSGDPGSSGETAQVAISGVADDYYYIRGVDATGTADGTDHWIEWRKPNRDFQISEAYMPHVLVNNGDGTWTYSSIEWTSSEAGDEVTAPEPRFIGKHLENITVHKGRLVLLAGENVVLSDVLDNFNFWPTSVRVALDTDPFSRQPSANTVSILRAAVPFRQNLFLTSDQVQFELATADNGVLSGTTAAFQQTTVNPCKSTVPPVLMGDVLYYVADGPAGAQLFEYYLEEGTFYNTAVEVTKHIPDYIPVGVMQLAADVNTGTLFLLTSGAQNQLYVYRTFFDATEKVQSAWSTYTFGATTTNAKILGIATFEGYLLLVIERGGGGTVYLEQMSIDPEAIISGIGYAPHMDRRCDVTGRDFNGTNTTFDLPYNRHSTQIYFVPPEAPGTARTASSHPTTSTFTVTGNFEGDTGYAGISYESYVTLSQFYARNEEGEAILQGRLQMLDMTVDYKNTAYFEVQVTPAFRSKVTSPLRDTSVILGIGTLEDPEDFDGTFRVPILAQNQDLIVTLTDAAHRFGIRGFTITSIEWRGRLDDFARGL